MSLKLQDQYDKIFKYCFFKVNNKEIAEDITQECFLKYFSQTSYINRGKSLAYLYTIARNQCIDYYKKEKSISFEEHFIDRDDSFNVVDDMKSFETSFCVRQAVYKLSKDKQEIILLRFSNDLGIGEIGIFLGISRFSVYRKLNAALKELKGTLREEDFND